MGRTFNREAAEQEANEIAFQFQNSQDVMADMSRAYHADFSGIRIHTDETAGKRVKAGEDALAAGKDVYFREGIYEGNDSASRGLVAHELAHVMQQGLAGGEAQGAMSEYAPAGAEQGGPLDWIKGLFGKKKKAQHLGSQKATDEASLAYMAAMKNREKEIVAEKRAAALGGLGPIRSKAATPEQLKNSSTLAEERVAASNQYWNGDGQETDDANRKARAMVLLQHRSTETAIGENDNQMRKNIFEGSTQDYENYLKAMDAGGADFVGMTQGTEKFTTGGKNYETNDAIEGMAQDIYSIASQYMLSDNGLDYIENMVNGIEGADVFQKGGVSPLNYAMMTMMTGEGIKAAKGMKLGQNYTQMTGAAADARNKLATEASRHVILPMTLENRGEDALEQMPPQIKTLYAQYQSIKQQIADALDARKLARGGAK